MLPQIVVGLLGSLIDLGKEVIVDKDKQIEFEYKVKELEHQLTMELVKTATVPWVDATIKMLVFLRPLGAALMTAFGMYCHYKGIDMDAATHAIFDGAFPAWGVSRHVNKQTESSNKKEVVHRWADDEEHW